MFKVTYIKAGVRYQATVTNCANRFSAEAKIIASRRVGRSDIKEITRLK